MTSPAKLTEKDLERISERFRIMGEPMRLKLLAALKSGEKSVTELITLTGGNQANISRHLSALYKGGIVSRRKQGTWVYYEIADPTVFELCRCVCGGIEGLQDARDAFSDDQ